MTEIPDRTEFDRLIQALNNIISTLTKISSSLRLIHQAIR